MKCQTDICRFCIQCQGPRATCRLVGAPSRDMNVFCRMPIGRAQTTQLYRNTAQGLMQWHVQQSSPRCSLGVPPDNLMEHRQRFFFSTLTLPSQQGFFASLKSFLQTTLTAGSPSQVARLETKFCVNVALAKLDSTNGAQQILSNLIRQKNPSMCCIAQTALRRISNC